ncbi:MAG: polyprenyl synthetase family protein [Chloroflexi bacterium]|nr:polyprenyl synthetase family protein [Chloroflexota bacterium]
MEKNALIKKIQNSIDKELRRSLTERLINYPEELVSMFNYQLGWDEEKNLKKNQGKRIRPLIVALSCMACGGDWQVSLPSAAAVELVHNFSLIHDDIQDHSETRRGKKTIWVKWGEAQAINTGDAMLTLAHLTLMSTKNQINDRKTLQCINLLQNACLQLTKGQYLDIAYEKKSILGIEDYWEMVKGKTASLLSACFGFGAILSDSDQETINKLMDFGNIVGLAFQVQDDWLGIWGDIERIGKSVDSDLINRKKTYPTLLGLQKQGEFALLWSENDIIDTILANRMKEALTAEGVAVDTQKKFLQLYEEGFRLLDSIGLDKERANPLIIVIKELLDRMK